MDPEQLLDGEKNPEGENLVRLYRTGYFLLKWNEVKYITPRKWSKAVSSPPLPTFDILAQFCIKLCFITMATGPPKTKLPPRQNFGCVTLKDQIKIVDMYSNDGQANITNDISYIA